MNLNFKVQVVHGMIHGAIQDFLGRPLVNTREQKYGQSYMDNIYRRGGGTGAPLSPLDSPQTAFTHKRNIILRNIIMRMRGLLKKKRENVKYYFY